MAEIGVVNSLVSELLANGRAKANHAVKLLAVMATSKQEAALKAAIQGLKQFFVAAGQDGLLLPPSGTAARPAKRQKFGLAAAIAASGSDAVAAAITTPGDAESQYREWLSRQYGNFVSQLLSLVTGIARKRSQQQQEQQQVAAAAPVAVAGGGDDGGGGALAATAPPLPSRSAAVQVMAATALMECVRSEMGPGTFSGTLYGKLLSGALLSPGVRPEVFAVLFIKFIHLADVRFYTLATIKAVAAKYGKNSSSKAEAKGEEGEEEDEAAAEAQAATAAADDAVATVSLPDLARNAYDVLCHVTEALPADTRAWSTWCGAVEFNLVAAAADKNESARLRRKRKEAERQNPQQQLQQQQQEAKHQQQRVQWGNALTQRRLYGDAWLALLALPLPPDVLRKALVRLPASVIPHMTAPQLLADFLTHCLNRGGLTGMLALNGLFLLVTRHGLEYPQFYPRLYQLLVPEVFAARTRAQFFRLADIFLSSSLVPAYTVAAFVKRFARLALGAPPAGAMIAITFIHNLLRRHPALNVMLRNLKSKHSGGSGGDVNGASMGPPNEGGDGTVGMEAVGTGAEATGSRSGLGGVDPYDEAEADPAKSRAVESSLWEVEALRSHYCPQVSTLCTVLDKDLTDRIKTAEVNLEDLLGVANGGGQQSVGAGSYNALFYGELARKLRKAPVAFSPQPPAALFSAKLDEDDWAGWAFNPEVAK